MQLTYLKTLFAKIVDIYKQHCLKFLSIQSSFFTFLFSIYKIVDVLKILKYLNISIGTVMKTSEMLQNIHENFKTEKICKHVVRKLLLINIRLIICVISLF